MRTLIDTLRLTTPAKIKRLLLMTPQQIAATGGNVNPVSVTSVDDSLFEDLAGAASDDIANFCGRDFKLLQYTERRNGTGTNSLVLSVWPIVNMISLSITGPRQTPTADEPTTPLTDGVDYAWTETGKLELYCSRFPKGTQNVVAVYQAGYEDVPNDLSWDATKWAAIRYRELDRLGQKSKSLGGETVNFDISQYAPDIAGSLANYRARSAIPGSLQAVPI